MWIDDQILRRHNEPVALDIFVPSTPLVVLGSGNDAQLEINHEGCDRLGVPVTRRYGGGGTVVLYPGCVVVSLGAWFKDPFKNTEYFKRVNQAVIDALAVTWPIFSNLSQAGISDIVCGEKKVAGTSLFRSRNYLLYQASILVHLDRDLVSACLAHPTKEPDYRKGRDHKNFLTSLEEILPTPLKPLDVCHALETNLAETLRLQCGSELISPVDSQMKSLVDRLARSSDV